MTETEEAVLGAILLSPSSLHLTETLDPFSMSADAGEILDAIWTLEREGKPVDGVTLITLLEKRGTLDKIGGRLVISGLFDRAVTAVDLEYHVKTLTDSAVARKLKTLWSEATGELEALESPLMISDKVIKETISITTQCVKGKALTTAEMTAHAHGILQEIYNGKNTIGTPTGLTYLDNITLGWQKSMTYCVTASRPGTGKSALVMQSLLTAQKYGPCLYVSGEMKRFMVWLRDMAARSKQKTDLIRSGRLDDRGGSELVKAVEAYNQERLHTLDRRAPTYPEIAREIIRIQNDQGPLSLLVVDMVQHIGAEGENEWDKIDNAVKHMTDIAERFDIPVVYVSRANRKEVSEGIPTLATPYGSSRIESDACAVFALCHSEDYLKPKIAKFTKKVDNKTVVPEVSQVWNRLGWQAPSENAIVLMTLKNRMGPMLDIPLEFDGPTFTFSQVPNLADAQAEAYARQEKYRK